MVFSFAKQIKTEHASTCPESIQNLTEASLQIHNTRTTLEDHSRSPLNLVPTITRWISVSFLEGREKPVIRLQRHPLIYSIFNQTQEPAHAKMQSRMVLALPSQGGTSTSSTQINSLGKSQHEFQGLSRYLSSI